MAEVNDYFSVAAATGATGLGAGARIHVIGVCGVAMAQLALVLAERGAEVSGSDKEFYEPMGGLLRRSSIRLCQGYASTNIPDSIDLVVIGNAVSRSNPEVQEVERRRLPYTLFPKLLSDLVIADRHSIVVSGTHGKTSTTAMAAFALQQCGAAPSYFIGGAARDLEKSLCIGSGKVSVVEGDEYDSAFFAKVPKFTFYRPSTLIVTSIEYDHADIYPNLEAIIAEFDKLVATLPPGARVIACVDDAVVRAAVPRWRARYDTKVISYAVKGEADAQLSSCREEGGIQQAVVRLPGGTSCELHLRLPGTYNMGNAVAVLLALEGLGIPPKNAAAALAQFRGVKRRQEVRLENPRVVLIEDFAHHPTAVRETLEGVRARYRNRTIWAVFEPRSNTSRRKVFQQAYVEAFVAATQTLLCNVAARSNDDASNLIDSNELAAAITAHGVPARALADSEQIYQLLTREVQPADIVVVMSNGSFGGLIDKLVAYWS